MVGRDDNSLFGIDFGALADSLAGEFGKLFGDDQTPRKDPFQGAIGQRSGGDPFGGAVGASQRPDPFGGSVGGSMGNVQPFQGYTNSAPQPFAGAWDVNPMFQPAADARAAAAAAKGQNTGYPSQPQPGPAPTSGGPSTGLDPNVAKWATQTQQTFGDLLDPDVMLAIMTNESGGDPNIQNRGGYPAYGLFQLWNQPGLTTDQQFQAARKLAQEKLTDLQTSYQRNVLNPDQRTRARDFALAWGGHFNYSTGLPDPNSRDPSGQTADQLAAVFFKNYDAIKNGRAQASAGGGSAGLAGVTPGTGGQVMQEFGVTPTSDQYKAAGNDVYGYGRSFGMEGGGHPGVDWAVPLGTKVATPLGGTVSVVGNDHGTGYYYQNTMGGGADPDHSGEFAVTLDNGDVLILGHLSQINAQVGQRVNAGALIGLSGGSDGAHVHVEYRQKQADGSYRVIDPRTVLGK